MVASPSIIHLGSLASNSDGGGNLVQLGEVPGHTERRLATKASQFHIVLDQGLKDFRSRIVEEFDRQICSDLASCSSYNSDQFLKLPVAPRTKTTRATNVQITLPKSTNIHPPSNEGDSFDAQNSVELRPDVSDASKDSGIKTPQRKKTINTMTPVSRWKHLWLLMMRPESYSSLSANRFVVRGVWTGYLDMVRRDLSNSHAEYNEALAKISQASPGNKMRTQSSVASILLGDTQMRAYEDLKTFHPGSRVRFIWVLLSFLLLLYDAVMLPISASFTIDDALYLDMVSWFGLFFWTCDIPMNFLSGRYVDGVLQIKLIEVARHYVRSWLIFDCVLVLLDWALATSLAIVGTRSMVSFEVNQSIRMLRLIRLLRLAKVPAILSSLLAIDFARVVRYSGLMRMLFSYVLYFHFSACLWYGIGRIGIDGWAHECDPHSAFSASCYLSAAHWALSSVHGTTGREYSTTLEWAFAVASLFVGMMLFAVLLEKTLAALASSNKNKKELRQRCAAYSRKHRLSAGLTHRLLSYIDLCDRHTDLRQRMREESRMMSSLPKSLQDEILDEARRPFIMSTLFMQHLNTVSPRIVLLMCAEAMISTIWLAGETVFSTGDVGKSWRIVESGYLIYRFGRDLWTDFFSGITARLLGQEFASSDSPNDHRHKGHKKHYLTRTNTGASAISSVPSDPNANRLLDLQGRLIVEGMRISEMVLWTEWVHTGDLHAIHDSVLLHLDFDSFSKVLKERIDTCLLIARYAEMYVRQLRTECGGISDLFEYEPYLQDQEEANEDEGVLTHLAFLSHYKAEAGTEATLMQEALEMIVARDKLDFDEDTAVFLDSEDLTDLSGLRDHVRNSRNLLLLLTPHVLFRPWCLVEIATASQHGIQIVPIEIQRPGLTFQYPDDEFYAKLHDGDLLDSQDAQFLQSESISLDQIEETVRFVFKQIALPFSPHKSKTVREAECQDILRRCLFGRKSSLAINKN